MKQPIKLSTKQLRNLITEAMNPNTVKNETLEDVVDLETFSAKIVEYFDELRAENMLDGRDSPTGEEYNVWVAMAVDYVVSAAMDAFETAKEEMLTGKLKERV